MLSILGLDAFLVKMTFLTPVTFILTSDPIIVLHDSGSGTGHFDQVWSESDVGNMWKRRVARRKKIFNQVYGNE